jgi:hypothetical protein
MLVVVESSKYGRELLAVWGELATDNYVFV